MLITVLFNQLDGYLLRYPPRLIWTCRQCETQIEHQFDACWKCGTSVDGRVVSDFRHADEWLPEIPKHKRQIHLSEMFLISNAIAFSLAGWKMENPIFLIVGISCLALMTTCRVIPRLIYKWQNRIRNSQQQLD